MKATKRLTIIDCKPYKVVNDKNGQEYNGYTYFGIDKEGDITRFTSKTEAYPISDTGGEYSENDSRDFVLYGRIDLGDKIKWSDYDKSLPL